LNELFVLQSLGNRKSGGGAGNGFFFTSGEFLHLLSNKIVNFPRRVASEMPRSRHLDPINPQTPRPSGPAIAGHSTSATRNELPAKDALEEIYFVKYLLVS